MKKPKHYVSKTKMSFSVHETMTYINLQYIRKVSLDGVDLKIHLREVKPYLSDLDWYQAGATENRGLINFSFDNESDWSDFRIRQMAHGSINNHSWTMSGSCKVVD